MMGERVLLILIACTLLALIALASGERLLALEVESDRECPLEVVLLDNTGLIVAYARVSAGSAIVAAEPGIYYVYAESTCSGELLSWFAQVHLEEDTSVEAHLAPLQELGRVEVDLGREVAKVVVRTPAGTTIAEVEGPVDVLEIPEIPVLLEILEVREGSPELTTLVVLPVQRGKAAALAGSARSAMALEAAEFSVVAVRRGPDLYRLALSLAAVFSIAALAYFIARRLVA